MNYDHINMPAVRYVSGVSLNVYGKIARGTSRRRILLDPHAHNDLPLRTGEGISVTIFEAAHPTTDQVERG